MSMPRDINARKYHRVAYQRLEDGVLLQNKLHRSNAAIYMTGYAVECILKALLLSSTPPRAQAPLLNSFRGAMGHDLMRLRSELGQCGISIPAHVKDELLYVSSWSTDLRYDPSPGKEKEARRFIHAT